MQQCRCGPPKCRKGSSRPSSGRKPWPIFTRLRPCKPTSRRSPPKWQKVKAKATDWDDPTEKDAFIKLSNAPQHMSDLDAWAERFVDEIMIPKFIARDWNVSHATSLYEDGKFAGPVSQVTPSHACVTCMS